MTPAERRAVLEAIARDEEAYPRDRIAAVRQLEEMDAEAPAPATGAFSQLDELKPRRKRKTA